MATVINGHTPTQARWIIRMVKSIHLKVLPYHIKVMFAPGRKASVLPSTEIRHVVENRVDLGSYTQPQIKILRLEVTNDSLVVCVEIRITAS